MGADLYIDHPSIKAAADAHHAEFERLIAERNAIGVSGYIAQSVNAYLDGYVPYAKLDRDAKAFLRTDAGKAYKAAQKAIDKNMESQPGYFRDSYNYSSVMQAMGLSWWACAREGGPQLINDEGTITLENLRLFIDVLKAATVQTLAQGVAVPKKLAGDSQFSFEARADKQAWIDKMTAKELKSWNTYFVSKKRKLIAFFNQAIKLSATVTASV